MKNTEVSEQIDKYSFVFSFCIFAISIRKKNSKLYDMIGKRAIY